MRRHLIALLTLSLVLAPAAIVMAVDAPDSYYRRGNWQIHATGPHYLDIGLGLFDAGWSDRKNVPAARIELRIGQKLGFIGPAIGFLANVDDGYFGYGGLYADMAYKKLVITPFLAAGAYEEGSGKDLGGTFQFRTALSLAYQCDNLVRLSLQLAHISNADLHDYNPGEEEIYLGVALPF